MKKFVLPPIFGLAVAYILGICLASYWDMPLILILILLLFIATLLILNLSYSLPLRSFYPYLFLFLLGLLLTSLVKCSLEKSLLLRLAHRKETQVVIGEVKSEPKREGDKVSFDLRVVQARAGGRTWQLSELTRVVARQGDNSWPGIRPGQRVKISGSLTTPKSFSSQFDYKSYLYHRRIQILLYTSSEQIKITRQPGWLDRAVYFCRGRFKETTRARLTGDRAGLLMGITWGDTSYISENLQENFRLTGLTHILAVSGLNVGLLAAVCFSVVRFLRIKELSQWGTIFSVVIFYALLTQCQPSVLRASVMVLVGGGAWLLGRDHDLVSSLSVAALVLLIYDPFSLFDIGFQLSFVATLALILITPILSSKTVLPKQLGNLFTVSVAAQLGVAPILVYYFQLFPLISVVANLLVVPTVAPIMVLGLIGGLAGMFSKVLSFPIYLLARPFLTYIIGMTVALSSLPGAALFLKSPHPGLILGYYLVLVGGLVGLRKWNFQINFRGILIICLTVATLVVWWQLSCGRPPSQLTVTFLDVGEGDAALVRIPEGGNILIDGGEDPQMVKQVLAQRGINRLDLLVLTHPHADHLGGLVGVAGRLPVKLVLDSGQSHPSNFYRRFLRVVRERHISYQVARRGQRYLVGEKLGITVLSPTVLFRDTESDLNNNSVVLKLKYGKFSLLFAGDVESEAQGQVVKSRGGELSSAVLKVPHHGGSRITTQFLEEVSPQVAVISVGAGNSYGHPSRSTLNKLKKLFTRIYRTDKNGDVTITSDGFTYKVVTER